MSYNLSQTCQTACITPSSNCSYTLVLNYCLPFGNEPLTSGYHFCLNQLMQCLEKTAHIHQFDCQMAEYCNFTKFVTLNKQSYYYYYY